MKIGADEDLIYATRKTRRSKLFFYFLILALFAVSAFLFFNASLIFFWFVFLAAAVLLVSEEVHLYVQRLYITTSGITIRHGLLHKRIRTIDFEDITNLQVIQSVFQRLLHIGTIEINSGEKRTGQELRFANVHNPELIKRVIEEQMRKRSYYMPKQQALLGKVFND